MGNRAATQRLIRLARFSLDDYSFFKDVVREEISKGADLNGADGKGDTALMCALWRGNDETALFLMELGAHTTCVNNWGATSLMAAAFGGSRKLCDLLLSSGGKVDAVDAWDETALIKAVTNGHGAELCDILSSQGVINSRSADGDTTLVRATYIGDFPVCRTLIRLGAQLVEEDWSRRRNLKSMRTSIERLLKKKSLKAQDLLRDDGDVCDEVLFAAADKSVWERLLAFVRARHEIDESCRQQLSNVMTDPTRIYARSEEEQKEQDEKNRQIRMRLKGYERPADME
jgi:Ankyrin repeats (3 copies)